jgi:hypothetical protein
VSVLFEAVTPRLENAAQAFHSAEKGLVGQIQSGIPDPRMLFALPAPTSHILHQDAKHLISQCFYLPSFS